MERGSRYRQRWGVTVTVGGTLTLNGATITNGTVTNQAGGTIDLNGGSLNERLAEQLRTDQCQRRRQWAV